MEETHLTLQKRSDCSNWELHPAAERCLWSHCCPGFFCHRRAWDCPWAHIRYPWHKAMTLDVFRAVQLLLAEPEQFICISTNCLWGEPIFLPILISSRRYRSSQKKDVPIKCLLQKKVSICPIHRNVPERLPFHFPHSHLSKSAAEVTQTFYTIALQITVLSKFIWSYFSPLCWSPHLRCRRISAVRNTFNSLHKARVGSGAFQKAFWETLSVFHESLRVLR